MLSAFIVVNISPRLITIFHFAEYTDIRCSISSLAYCCGLPGLWNGHTAAKTVPNVCCVYSVYTSRVYTRSRGHGIDSIMILSEQDWTDPVLKPHFVISSIALPNGQHQEDSIDIFFFFFYFFNWTVPSLYCVIHKVTTPTSLQLINASRSPYRGIHPHFVIQFYSMCIEVPLMGNLRPFPFY